VTTLKRGELVMATHKQGKKNRKLGRNKVACAWYRSTHRREKNKIRKILRHLKKHTNDLQAHRTIIRLQELVG
jgi:hypothetical protein